MTFSLPRPLPGPSTHDAAARVASHGPRLSGGPRLLAASTIALSFLLPVPGGTRPATAEEIGGTPPATVTTPAERAAGPASLPHPPSVPGVAPPADLRDLGAWLDYKRTAHLYALPDEARLFYRRGLLAQRAGQAQEATRLVRGAAELDPGFVTPHLTLASWSLTRDASQALLRYAVVLQLVRQNFLNQIELAANLVFFTMHGLFVGLLATSLIIVLIHQAELRHIWEERLSRKLRPASARAWAWAILLVPFAAGLGLALPALAFMGMLWPVLRARERAVCVALLLALVAAPFAGHVLGRLATPLREEEGPLYGVASLQDAAWSPVRQAALERLAGQHPDNPFLQFGLGWSARQGGDLVTAEAAYRRAQTLWPQDARVLNNLANVLVAQGRLAPAIDLYRAAISADPENAAAPFNLSQVYTRQFEYRAASEAAARASALDFELVKSQQSLGTEDGVLPLADQWIAPAAFWATVLDHDALMRTEPALPVVWHRHVETSGLPFAALALLVAIVSLMTGVRWQRSLPLRPCHNCGRAVCRRCSQRRRELALCPACAKEESHAESPEFARVLLARQRGRKERGHRLLRTTLATLLPGYGLLAFHRVIRATFLIVTSVLLSAPWFGVTAPFSFQSGAVLDEGGPPPVVPLVAWILVYAFSLLGYLSQSARADEQRAALARPVRSRPTRASQSTAKAA